MQMEGTEHTRDNREREDASIEEVHPFRKGRVVGEVRTPLALEEISVVAQNGHLPLYCVQVVVLPIDRDRSLAMP